MEDESEDYNLDENELWFTLNSMKKTLGFITISEHDIPNERCVSLEFKLKIILAFLCVSHNIEMKDTFDDLDDEKYHVVKDYES